MAIPLDALLQTQMLASLLLCLPLLALIHKYLVSASKLPLPPGPPGHWLFGNHFPDAFTYRKFEQWTQQYGPVFSMRQGFTTVIVVGRQKAVFDIMEKEGAATADRPRSISAGETLSGGMRVMHTPVGERLRKIRKALHAHLQPKSISGYAPVLMCNARQLIFDIVEMPERHQDHAKRYSASLVMSVAYGKQPKSYADPDVQAVTRCLTRLGNALRPGAWKVDVWPFLRYVPGYLKELQDGHAEELALFKNQLAAVESKMNTPNSSLLPSFAQYLLRRQELELTDNEMAYLAGGIFGAGSDMTSSAISIAVMAAACYPEAQAKVQAEVEAVMWRARADCVWFFFAAPTFADQENLPQTMAFVLETFRWRPVSAGGFAHKATKDIIWEGYLIPKGASIFGNIWSVGRDPNYFPNPERFDPQRWIDQEGSVREGLKSYAFEFGRRACPGQLMATASIFLTTALTQWAFTIKPNLAFPIDEYAFTKSANAQPLPFRVFFEPRASRTCEGIRELMQDYGI